MIIQCPKCLTKFKIDDTKVKDEGTKVRCSRCKEVFVVTKEPEAATPPSAPLDFLAEKGGFDFSFAPEEEKKGDEAVPSFDELSERETKEKAEEEIEWGGMSYGEVSLAPPEEALPKREPLGGTESLPKETAFGDVEFGKEPDFEAPLEIPDVPLETAPPIKEKKPKEPFKEEVPKGTGFTEEMPIAGIGPGALHEESLGERKREKGPSSLRTAVLAIAVLGLVAVPLWYLWMNYKIAEPGEISLADLNGYYTQNSEAGNIFVIAGRAVNSTNKARSFFQVKGTLFDKKGEKLAQKEVYCGNIFSTKEVTTLPRGKIEADLKNKVGNSLANINLASGKSVPFMIVFFDLPKDMAEFSVEVSGFQTASE